MSAFSFSPNIPNKIGKNIQVSGKNTLIKTETDGYFRAAIADEPIDAKVDGKKLFCVRVDKAVNSMMFGFTPMETFDSNTNAYFGWNGFAGCGIYLIDGYLRYPVNSYHNIIDEEISKKAKEIIVILTISNNGKNEEIRFLCDGVESKTTDVSGILKEDRLFPAICLGDKTQQVTTIPIDEIEIRTPEIEELIKEYQQEQKERQDETERGQFTSNALRQLLELQHIFLQQAEIQIRAVMARSKFEMKN